jgi:DNA replication protein DnaC
MSSGATSASPRRCCQPRCPPRESHGGEGRIKAARFPARKTLEEFDFTFQRSVKKTIVEHLGQLDFLHARENVILLGPPDRGSRCTFLLRE